LKRILLLLTVVLAAVPLFAFTPVTNSNASQNTGTTRAVMEPIISAQSINGTTHGAVAYVNFPDAVAAPLSVQIQVAHTNDFVNWSTPVNLPLNATNGITYQNSADPVFIEYGSNLPFYTNWLFCFGTLWTNTNNHGRSTIGAWHSTDGGLTWSQPDAIDAPPYDPSCEAAGTCIFDDKPAAALSTANGVIFVSFTRTTSSSTNIYMSELLPSRGWASIGQIGGAMPSLPGPTPVVDASTNICWLFYMDRVAQTIHTFSSGDGWIWNEIAEVASAPGINVGAVIAGQSAGRATTSVQAFPFLAAKFDSLYHFIDLVYHRDEAGVTQVVARRFNPFSHAWTGPQVINPNGHTQWNPTIVQLSNYNFVFSYYDYTPGDVGYTLYASRMDVYSNIPETSRIFTSQLSDPAGYNTAAGVSRIGEYQGLAVLNDTLYAATTYIPQSTPRVGNAWVVKFTTP
jgi:hypothetical protein